MCRGLFRLDASPLEEHPRRHRGPTERVHSYFGFLPPTQDLFPPSRSDDSEFWWALGRVGTGSTQGGGIDRMAREFTEFNSFAVFLSLDFQREMHWRGTNAEGELYGFRTIVRPEVIWSWDEVVPRVDTMRMFLECPIKKKHDGITYSQHRTRCRPKAMVCLCTSPWSPRLGGRPQCERLLPWFSNLCLLYQVLLQ